MSKAAMCKVKICGLRRMQDVQAVNAVLPEYAGFVFADSRRRIDTETAAVLKAQLDRRIKAVGVFVNESLDTVEKIYRSGTIDQVQLHGDEDSAYIRLLKERCGCPVIKAVGIGSEFPALPEGADYFLFDTLSSQRGGTGTAFDWSILKDYSGIPYFLAGGLSVGNVSDALRMLSPFCVDVSGGVETSGVKDAQKITQFVRQIRQS